MDRKDLLLILSVVFPCIAVYIGSEGHPCQLRRTIIAVILQFLLFHVPGVIYALDINLDRQWFYDKLDNIEL